jgi:hypothetical protein
MQVSYKYLKTLKSGFNGRQANKFFIFQKENQKINVNYTIIAVQVIVALKTPMANRTMP